MMRGCVTQPRKTDKIQPTVIYDLGIPIDMNSVSEVASMSN